MSILKNFVNPWESTGEFGSQALVIFCRSSWGDYKQLQTRTIQLDKRTNRTFLNALLYRLFQFPKKN